MFDQLKVDETDAITKALVDPDSGVPALAQSGLHLGGVKYMVVQGEAGVVIRGKKVRGSTLYWCLSGCGLRIGILCNSCLCPDLLYARDQEG